MEELNLVKDMFKIYNAAIEANSLRVFQTLSHKYSVIDKSMMAGFIYLKILDKLNMYTEDLHKLLINYLLKPVISSETGNVVVSISDLEKNKYINKIINEVISDKFEYINNKLTILKIEFETIDEHCKCEDILSFSDELAGVFIKLQIYLLGNEMALSSVIDSIKQIKRWNSKINEEIDLIINELDSMDLNNDKDQMIKNLLNGKIRTYYKFIQVIFNLKDVIRFSHLHNIIKEDVLQHTYINYIIGLCVCNYLVECGEPINKYEILLKILFHDFGEFKGNEIITIIKNYNDETKKIFGLIEESDEEELRNILGENLFNVLKSYKIGQTGYVADIFDKMFGMMKVYIEKVYYGNATVVKVYKTTYKDRFEKYLNFDRLDTMKDKEFLVRLYKEVYLFIRDYMFNKTDEDILNSYYTAEEIKNHKDELIGLKNGKLYL